MIHTLQLGGLGRRIRSTGGGGGSGPGAHRYWRINITANDGSALYFGFTEVELRASIGGPDLTNATNQVQVLASSEINSSNSAYRGMDNSDTTGWLSSTATTSWWRYDFGSIGHIGNSIEQVLQVLIRGSHNVPTASPKDFTLQWSDNGSTWTTAMTVTGQTGWTGASDARTFNV